MDVKRLGKLDIPFNQPHTTGHEFEYIKHAINEHYLSGDGIYTEKCNKWLEKITQARKTLLTHSCTAALEMAAILIDIQPGDEVIMPSYTFVSTANAFVLRGAVPVFVDIRPDTQNIDETLIEQAITNKTKAIVPVHYAGVSCNMIKIMEIADKHGLYVIEDAAQALFSKYEGQPVGCRGHFAAVSFHETKNVISGEGGCLLINDESFIERAEIIREKGTNRSMFFRGQVDKYTWVDIGSSYLPSDILAAFLWAQLQQTSVINQKRIDAWNIYYSKLSEFTKNITLPEIPKNCKHNAHMFYFLTEFGSQRDELIEYLACAGINSVFHYVPLHSSPAGRKFGRTASKMNNTNRASERLLRLPLWVNISEHDINRVCGSIEKYYEKTNI